MTRIFGVIMAGGVGTRFWPRSREKTPKQALEITGKETMIQSTAGRLTRLVDPHNLYVITNKMQRALLAKQLSYVPEENILDEPVGRNTAPCIGLAALHCRRADPDAVMIVIPADHVIQHDQEFLGPGQT